MSAPSGILTHESGLLVLDLSRRELRARGVSVPIGGRAFEILAILVQSAGELVLKDELMRGVWPGAIVEENTLQAHIAAIRKALGADRNSLKTVFGRGYRLVGNWTPRAASGYAQPPSPEPSSVAKQGSRTNAGQPDRSGRARLCHSARGGGSDRSPGGDIDRSRGNRQDGFGAACRSKCVYESQVDAYFVNLASLSDPHLVPSTIASILNVRLGSEESDAASVARAIGARQLLLVIDNCEHLIDAVANMTETMIQMCRGVSVLATSRENLRIVDEYVYRVGPLSIPTEQDLEPDVILAQSAVQLFMARINPAQATFWPDPANLLQVLQCAGDSMVFRSRSNLLQRAPPRLGSPRWRPDWMIVLSS